MQTFLIRSLHILALTFDHFVGGQDLHQHTVFFAPEQMRLSPLVRHGQTKFDVVVTTNERNGWSSIAQHMMEKSAIENGIR